MQNDAELNITVKVDTQEARREVAEFRLHALRVVEEIRAAYAALGQELGVGAGPDSGPGRRVL